jgi:hypothetical protein
VIEQPIIDAPTTTYSVGWSIFIAVALISTVIWGVIDHVWRRDRNSRRLGLITAGIGAMMKELDRLYARPSAEYMVEAENPVLKREDDAGDR